MTRICLVPTQRTRRLATALLQETRRTSGAEAVAHYRDHFEAEQLLALIGVLLTRATSRDSRPLASVPRPTLQPPPPKEPRRRGRPPSPPTTMTEEEITTGVRLWWRGIKTPETYEAHAAYKRRYRNVRKARAEAEQAS